MKYKPLPLTSATSARHYQIDGTLSSSADKGFTAGEQVVVALPHCPCLNGSCIASVTRLCETVRGEDLEEGREEGRGGGRGGEGGGEGRGEGGEGRGEGGEGGGRGGEGLSFL